MEEQTLRFGAELEFTEVEGLADLEKPVKVVKTYDRDYTTKSIIIATGGAHNKLGAPGEDEFAGRGVSYCAVCDGNFFRGQDVVVVGGGDSAIDEGLYLSGIVNSVTVIHRRDELRATKVLQDRAFANPKMKFLWSHVVEEFVGDAVLEAAKVKDLKNGEVYNYPAAAAFIYVGFHPNTEYLKGLVDMDPLRSRLHRHSHAHQAAGRLQLRRRAGRVHPPVGGRRWRRHHRRPCRISRLERVAPLTPGGIPACAGVTGKGAHSPCQVDHVVPVGV